MTTNEMTKLVNRAMNRDNEAMERLYKEFYGDVYFVCKKYSLNDADANDITQDTFIQAFEKLATLDNGAKFKAWVTRIAANKCLDMLKHNNVLDIDSMYDENDEIIDIPDVSKFTEDIIVDNEVREILVSMMEKLPVEQRVTLFMYYYQNYSIREIALAYGCSENTVKSRLNYAKKAMRAEAEKLEGKGIKLRVVAILPFLYAFFQSERDVFACQVPDSTAMLGQVMENLMHSKAVVSTTGNAVTGAANAIDNTSISGGAGAVSKSGAAKGLWIKIAAGVIGVAAVVGGVIAAITLSGDDEADGNSTGIVQESTTGDNAADENVTDDTDNESTTQGNIEPDEKLVEFFEMYKSFIEKQLAGNISGGVFVRCDYDGETMQNPIVSHSSNLYNLFSKGTLTMENNTDEYYGEHFIKLVTYGLDGQLYLYEKPERAYVDDNGNEILSPEYNKYTRTPVEKVNIGQLWIDFLSEIITNHTVTDVEEDTSKGNISFNVTLTGKDMLGIFEYTSVIEYVNYLLQYSTDKRFEDYTYEVSITLTGNSYSGHSMDVISEELLNDLIKSYAVMNGIKNTIDKYTLTNDPSYQLWRRIGFSLEFYDYESERFCYYPYYIDVEASGNNVLAYIQDTTEPYYILLPNEIQGYEHTWVSGIIAKFKDTSDENVEKRITIDDTIGSYGKYGMEMAKDSTVKFKKTVSELVVNKTTIGERNVYYILDEKWVNEAAGEGENTMCLYAQVEIIGSEAAGDSGYVSIIMEYEGKDGLPSTDGMLETLTYIVENMEYVEIDAHLVPVK